MSNIYDIIVVGGGHAGCEAAMAAAKLGSKVLLLTINKENVAQMSCNPAMGGVAKGQIIREIDALGGYSGIVADQTMVQFRMLNKSKGPAMWSPRSQNDRILFSQKWREILEAENNISFWQDIAVDIKEEKDGLIVETLLKQRFFGKAVIITCGTFLNGKIFIGKNEQTGGRIGEASVYDLTKNIERFGIKSDRLKTGTPVRVDGRSLDFKKFIEQKGDINPKKFSFTNTKKLKKQRSCYIAYTNEKIHDILKEGFKDSPLFQGRIKSSGPRYCPSIEDKISRFADKERHQLFIEPEGWNIIDYYINGFSSSLPYEIQERAIKSIIGFENAKIIRPGYAVEYDYFPPTQLNYSLESRIIENLYFAGQVNGTTGYEEAAAQGFIAGINAHRKINNQKEIILKRDEAYIGVLIDDLINKGTQEPYRMFTSRAEYRILLRQDNADTRLTPLGHKIGLISEERHKDFIQKQEDIVRIKDVFFNENATPKKINNYLKECKTSTITEPKRLNKILLRPQVEVFGMIENLDTLKLHVNEIGDDIKEDVLEAVEILIKYEGYIVKEKENAERIRKFEDIKISKNIEYKKIQGISMEGREKLDKLQPSTIGQAARISGVSPADIQVLLIYIGRI